MIKPYQSIAIEIYTKLPYNLPSDICIKIMKEVKKKELSYYDNINMYDPFNPIVTFHIRLYGIFSKINKRSYYMYFLKKIFKKMKENFYIIRNLKINDCSYMFRRAGFTDTAIKTRDTGVFSRKLQK